MNRRWIPLSLSYFAELRTPSWIQRPHPRARQKRGRWTNGPESRFELLRYWEFDVVNRTLNSNYFRWSAKRMSRRQFAVQYPSPAQCWARESTFRCFRPNSSRTRWSIFWKAAKTDIFLSTSDFLPSYVRNCFRFVESQHVFRQDLSPTTTTFTLNRDKSVARVSEQAAVTHKHTTSLSLSLHSLGVSAPSYKRERKIDFFRANLIDCVDLFQPIRQVRTVSTAMLLYVKYVQYVWHWEWLMLLGTNPIQNWVTFLSQRAFDIFRDLARK